MASQTIALAAQNTIPFADAGVWTLVFPHGNRIHLTNMGPGNVWVRFDGQTAAVDDQSSLQLPTDASISNMPYHHHISVATDGATDVAIWCS